MGARDRNHCQNRSARSSTGRVTTTVTWLSPPLRGEQRQLLRFALYLRVEPEHGPELIEIRLLAGHQAAQVVGFEDMPVLLVERSAQKGRARQLEAGQLDPLRRRDADAPARVWGRDAGAALQQRLGQQRGPLDLEHEGGLAAQVPDAVERLQG